MNREHARVICRALLEHIHESPRKPQEDSATAAVFFRLLVNHARSTGIPLQQYQHGPWKIVSTPTAASAEPVLTRGTWRMTAPEPMLELLALLNWCDAFPPDDNSGSTGLSNESTAES